MLVVDVLLSTVGMQSFDGVIELVIFISSVMGPLATCLPRDAGNSNNSILFFYFVCLCLKVKTRLWRERQFYVVSMAEVISRLEFANVAALATTTISLIILKGTVAHALHFLSIPSRTWSSAKMQKIVWGIAFLGSKEYDVMIKILKFI